jgi:hypothetical protein
MRRGPSFIDEQRGVLGNVLDPHIEGANHPQTDV